MLEVIKQEDADSNKEFAVKSNIELVKKENTGAKTDVSLQTRIEAIARYVVTIWSHVSGTSRAGKDTLVRSVLCKERE
jgi:hypothetical protein